MARLKRMRPVTRKMSWAAFRRVPRLMGWRHEYIDGQAYMCPSYHHVGFRLVLAPRDARAVRGLRDVEVTDAKPLRDSFAEAFAAAPDFCIYTMAEVRKKAARFIDEYFGDVRGERSPASTLVERGGRIIAAALIKQQPLIDFLFVVPDYARRGLATAVMSRAVNVLVDDGKTELVSGTRLANAASLAWHTRFGFREIPSESAATARWRCYVYELERHEELGDLSAGAHAELVALERYWWDESERLEKLQWRERRAAEKAKR